MKRLLALFCSLAILASFAACGGAGTDTTTAPTDTSAATSADSSTATPAETQPPKAFDSVPAQNLGGTFHIRYAQADNCFEDFHAETEIGDVKNDAIYTRNAMVEDKLGVDIQISWTDYKAVDTDCRLQVQSGDQSYDMFGGHRDSMKLSYAGMQYDLSDISTLDLSREWWDQGYIEAVTVNDSLYTVIGDIGVSTLLFVSSLTFNKALMDENNITYPYDLVKEGKWTMEALLGMTTDYGTDLNGDGQIKRADDMLSIIGWGYESAYSGFYSSGFSFVTRDNTGASLVAFNTEQVIDILDDLLTLWTDEHAYINMGNGEAEHEATYTIFAQGRALFSDIILSKIGTFYSGMEQDYGIVPLPKHSEEQANYETYLGYTIPLLYLPNNVKDPERIGTIMEALCTASYDEVTPKMYEIVTKLKNVRDEESSEMIEIIIRNKHIDTAHFYNLTGFGNLAFNTINNKSATAASRIESYIRVANNEWAKIMDQFDKIS